jgi:hypothetical protein
VRSQRSCEEFWSKLFAIQPFRPDRVMADSANFGAAAASTAERRRRIGLPTEEKSMSFVSIQPEGVSSAASNAHGIVEDPHITAHSRMYQTVSAQAAPVHQMFVSTLSAGGESSATTAGADVITAG